MGVNTFPQEPLFLKTITAVIPKGFLLGDWSNQE